MADLKTLESLLERKLIDVPTFFTEKAKLASPVMAPTVTAATAPTFFIFVRKIGANSVNSCPPERVFSILNDTYADDQERALADYKEHSLMMQYNDRSRRK